MRRSASVRLVTLLVLGVLLALVVQAAPFETVVARIPASCRFYGPVTVCGAEIEAGTEITVRVLHPDTGPSWTATTFLVRGVPHYRIDIPPDDFPEPGGVEGGTVYFTVTGVTYEGSSFPANLKGPDATWRKASALYHPLRVGTPGDANMDGVIDMADVETVQRIIMGLEPVTPCADANQDGVVNIKDIFVILSIINP